MLLIALTLAHGADDRGLVATDGWDRLDAVERIAFTFVAEKGGAEAARRTWTWEPATGAATRTVGDQTLAFTFGSPKDDAQREADAQLINDLFWLAPPLHLQWTQPPGLVVTDGGEAPLPLGEGEAHKVTMTYADSSGGYTPGDAYDLYLDADGRIQAWTYRKGGGEPTLSTSFEGYVDAGPLHVATDHRAPDGSLRIQTTDVKVTSR